MAKLCRMPISIPQIMPITNITTAVRIITSDPGTCIDELEVYGAPLAAGK